MARMTNGKQCKCGRSIITRTGDPKARVAVLGDYPFFDELRSGVAFRGSIGDILRSELGKVGVQFEQLYGLHFWNHIKTDECDVALHAQQTLEAIKDCKLILMLGNDPCQHFLGYSAPEISGTIQKSKFLPKSIIVAGPIPASFLRGPIGELKLAIEKFTEQRRKLK